jgi:hypothetical protein
LPRMSEDLAIRRQGPAEDDGGDQP